MPIPAEAPQFLHLRWRELFVARPQVRLQRGVTISLDPGWDPGETWDAGIEGLYGLLDILFVNRVEAVALGSDPNWRRAADRLARRTPVLVVKGGPEAASAIQDGRWEEHPGFRVDTVDPTGAGDAFNAGFLFGYLAGWPRATCLTWGNACGALTVGQAGGRSVRQPRGCGTVYPVTSRGWWLRVGA